MNGETGKSAVHVFWDWNGTLLDDTEAALAALNAVLGRRSLPLVSMQSYRAEFAFPVRPYYERVGLRLDEEDWDALAREYHDAYLPIPKRLTTGALEALGRLRAAGVRQSVVSALRDDLLHEAVRTYGVEPYLTHVVGSDNLDGASKLNQARALLSRIGTNEAVLVGDAVHDGEIARALGIRAVLFAGGSHAGDRLRRVAPTGDTLDEVVNLILSAIQGNGKR